MSGKPRNAAAHNNSVSILIDKLSTVVKEHYDGAAQLEGVELDSLRCEVLHLRDEIARLKLDEPYSKLIVSSAGELNDQSSYAQEQVTSSTVVDGSNKLCSLAQSACESLTCDQEDQQGTEEVDARNDDAAEIPTFQSHRRSFMADEQEMKLLEKKFCALDPERKEYIDINKLSDWMTKHLNHNRDHKDAQMRKYRIAVHKLNKVLGIHPHSVTSFRKGGRGHIQLPSFRVLMLGNKEHLQNHFGNEVTQSLMDMRETLVQDFIVQEIADTWRLSASEIEGTEVAGSEKWDVMDVLEPVAGAMICLNALSIGFSLDWEPNWKGWLWVETFFTCFFVTEFLIRVRQGGCYRHFFGSDWAWNWFDFLIVCSAVLDNVLSLLAESGLRGMSSINLNHLLILRLARLARISRLLKLLRLKIFRELLLMVNGAISGSRTLFWAMLLLAIVVYSLGVFMRQIMDFEDEACVGAPWGGRAHTVDDPDCNRGWKNMGRHGYLLFGSVARSMLTVFTCFTDGCESPDGTPLVWHLWDTRGPLLVLGYVASFVLVVFGVLNLVCSVFVENTLANSQKFDAQRDFGDKKNKVKKAQELRDLLIKVCTSSDSTMPKAFATKKSASKSMKDLWRKHVSHTEVGLQSQPHTMHVSLHITQDQFEEIMLDPKVHVLLDDLDISWSSREQLFHILDADGNGVLAISELVDGIMKLRGPADKGDFVSSVLMVRQLQKQLSKFESTVKEDFQIMSGSLKKTKPLGNIEKLII